MKVTKILARAIQIIFIILGLFGGMSKLLGSEMEVKTFQQMGFSNTIMMIFGILQLGGALLLILPRTLLYGAIILLLTFIVSTIALFANNVLPTAFIPLVFLVLTIVLIAFRKNLQTA